MAQVKRRQTRGAGRPDPAAQVICLSPDRILEMKPYLCCVCDKRFKRIQNMQLHYRSHNLPVNLQQQPPNHVGGRNSRVYVCPVPTCKYHHPSRALSDITGIKKHFGRKHCGVRNWICHRCSKPYAIECDLKAHIKRCKVGVVAAAVVAAAVAAPPPPPLPLNCDGNCSSTSLGTHSSYCKALSRDGAGKLIGEENGPKDSLPPRFTLESSALGLGGASSSRQPVEGNSFTLGSTLSLGGSSSYQPYPSVDSSSGVGEGNLLLGSFTLGSSTVLSQGASSSRQPFPSVDQSGVLFDDFTLGSTLSLGGSYSYGNQPYTAERGAFEGDHVGGFTLGSTLSGISFSSQPCIPPRPRPSVERRAVESDFSTLGQTLGTTSFGQPLLPHSLLRRSTTVPVPAVQSKAASKSNSFFAGGLNHHHHHHHHQQQQQQNNTHVAAPFPYGFNLQSNNNNINGFMNNPAGINSTTTTTMMQGTLVSGAGEINQPEIRASGNRGGTGELSYDQMLAEMEEAMGLGACDLGPVFGSQNVNLDDSMF